MFKKYSEVENIRGMAMVTSELKESFRMSLINFQGSGMTVQWWQES